MQVQFGNQVFTKTKFDGLDGKTTVAFTTEDDQIQGKATSAGVSFRMNAEAHEFQELADVVKTFGQLLDATWAEHQKLRPKLSRSLTGH